MRTDTTINQTHRCIQAKLRESKRSASRHEYAEGVAVTIGVDAQRLVWVA
jgi:hypothetical protein